MNPFPPLGAVFLSHLSPVSISPLGVCAFNQQSLPAVGRPVQTGRFVAFDEITESSTDGAYLLVNNQRLAKCATSRQACKISDLINAVTSAATSDREGMVRDHVAKQFAVDGAAARLQAADIVLKPIRSMCSVLFLFIFIATPILVSILGLLPLLIPVFVGMIVLAVEIAILFYRAHKKLYPSDSYERIEGVVKMVLCPPVAIRAIDLLGQQVLADYSPVVLATLLPGPAVQQFLRAFILDLQHPLKHDVADGKAVQTIIWAAAEQFRLCNEHIKNKLFSGLEILFAPPQRELDSRSYCPRCRCHFTAVSGECSDCAGVALVAFPK